MTAIDPAQGVKRGRRRPVLHRTSVGALALTGASAIRLTLQFALLPILARLIGPAEYGLVSLAMPFILLANVLSDGGMGYALGRQKEASRDLESTVFWLAAAIGGALALFCVAAAFPWARDPQPAAPPAAADHGALADPAQRHRGLQRPDHPRGLLQVFRRRRPDSTGAGGHRLAGRAWLGRGAGSPSSRLWSARWPVTTNGRAAIGLRPSTPPAAPEVRRPTIGAIPPTSYRNVDSPTSAALGATRSDTTPWPTRWSARPTC